MRPRDLLLCLGALTLLAGVAFVILGEPSAASALPPPGLPDLLPPKDAPPEPPHLQPGVDPEVVEGGPVRPSQVGTTDPVFTKTPRAPDTSTWTKGVILGDIALSAAVVDRIQTLQIVIDELRSLDTVRKPEDLPYHKVIPVHFDVGTPTFVIENVPFSDYGYVVRVHAPGLNGSQQTVMVTEDSKYVDDVRLSVTAGAPFTLLLRDQDHQPVAFVDVRLLPVGVPLGRPPLDGRADNYGSVVYDCALAGDYEVLIGPKGQPMINPPPVVTVQPGGRLYAGNIVQPQGQTLVVPRGQPLKVVVKSYGYGVPDVAVRMRATDRVKLTVFEATTDVRGECSFPHLLPGEYQVDFVKEGWQRRTRAVSIRAGEAAPDLVLELIRL